MSKFVRRMRQAYCAAVLGAIAIGAGEADPVAAASSAPPTRDLSVCVVVPHFKDEYWLSVAYGLETEAEAAGVSLWTYESGGYHALQRQIELLGDCVARGADAILLGAVSADDPDLLGRISALSERTPILALVNELRSPELAGAIGVDWRDMGSAIGRFLAERHPDPGQSATAVLISGPRESGWAPLLEAGLRQGLLGSGVSIVDVRSADTGLREQMREVELALQEHPGIDYLIGSAPATEAAIGLLAAGPHQAPPSLLATYISHSIRRGLSGGRVLSVPFDDPVEQGRLGIQMALEAVSGRTSQGLKGPAIELLASEPAIAQKIPLSPSGFVPKIQ
ncbi:TMAO reductase system periplasmic protein TorT [Tropicimonas sp. TH_r6]|uniref:TMAO reductase system periplasmic protein TorT n=1 Tax=Tropicimonas sp. TH_r6 TaxID=3082085 RepID=UPI002953821A|nr:TMAO reductase system periplasmic protein TorT [Tropicimonas sp. TH_r6]MDV7145854.1 TMAO reductase system periplasmic protein TorT [Tropicimonas sp. TH_r6]